MLGVLLTYSLCALKPITYPGNVSGQKTVLEWKLTIHSYVGHEQRKALLASIIKKIDSGDDHKFCTTLMDKTVNRIEILNFDWNSDHCFWQCVFIF